MLRLRFGDFATASRSRTLPEAAAQAGPIAAAALGLLDGAMPLVERRGITLVGLTVTNLVGPDAGGQLALPFDESGAPAQSNLP